jgi:hypothetical protein
MANSASMFADDLGAATGRLSAAEVESGSAKLDELARLTLAAAEVPRLVPFGP